MYDERRRTRRFVLLSCIANLSNDEVFTPPDVVNKMLDLLPQELFADPSTTFLDPATKTGVFLREIAKRCLAAQLPGYEERNTEINDKKALNIPLDEYDIAFQKQLKEKIDHIFHKQLYGIGITELTSLLARRSVYCSKYPNGPYSITHFDDAEGNIRFRRTEHVWKKGKCIWCGASQKQYDRDQKLESHAYEFIHTQNPEDIFNMKFDVIISNPPYQLNDGGAGKSAKPIYHHFVESAKKLNPSYIVMVIPSRWFSGGKGLESFRNEMLNDAHIKELVDYENFKDIFPGVDLAGGACYFLWDKNYNGLCSVTNYNNDSPSTTKRALNEYDIFIRQNLAIEIVEKIQKKYTQFLDKRVSSRKPFGLPTNYEPKDSGISCHFIQKIGIRYALKSDVEDSSNYLNKWKLLAPKSPIAGQTDFTKPVGFYYDGNTRIAKPGECCTESWIVLGAFNTKSEVESFKTYIFTKVVRFLLLQTVVSQDVTRKNFCFIPDLGKYEGIYTDKSLCKKWDITENEWAYIKTRIGEIGGNN